MSATSSPSSADNRSPTRDVADHEAGVDQQPFSGLQLSSQDVADLVEGVDFDSPVFVGETSRYDDLLEGIDFSEPLAETSRPPLRMDIVPIPPEPLSLPGPSLACALPQLFNRTPEPHPHSQSASIREIISPSQRIVTVEPEKEEVDVQDCLSLPSEDLLCQYHIVIAKGCKSCTLCQDVFHRMEYSQYYLVGRSVDHTRELPASSSSSGQRVSVVMSFMDFWSRWCRQPRDEYEWEMFNEEYESAIINDAIEAEYWSVVKDEVQYLEAWEQKYRINNEYVKNRKRSYPFTFDDNSNG